MLRRSWAPLFLFTCFLGAHDLPDQPPEWTHYLLMGAAQEAGSCVIVSVGDDVHHNKTGDDVNGVRNIVDRRYPLLQGEAEDDDIKG